MADIFSNLKTRVGRKIQKTDSAYKTKIADFLNDRYSHVYDRFFWSELYRETVITATAGEPYIILQKGASDVLYVSDRANDILVRKVGVQNFIKRYLSTLDVNGTIYNYSDWGVSPLATQLSTSDKVTVVSSSASDTTQKVYIRGFDANGEELNESISLNGTSNVDSANTYSAYSITNSRSGISMVSKDADTVGVVTITEKVAGTTLGRLGPLERTVRHKIIRVRDVPTGSTSLYVGLKEPLRKFVNDGDVPQFDCEEIIVAGALADCLTEQRQYNRAQVQEAHFEKLLISRMQQEERDNEDDGQTTPDAPLSDLEIDMPRTL